MVRPTIGSGFGVGCTACGDTVIAPHWSQFLCKDQVRHFWICESCGQRFDTTVELAGTAGRKLRGRARAEGLGAVA